VSTTPRRHYIQTPSFHDAQLRIVDGPKYQTRNDEISGSMLRIAPE
jgi:hypothetical protein